MNPIKTCILFSLLIVSPSYAAQPVMAAPECEPAPQNATKEEKDCFADACTTYHAAWRACDTPECKTAAALEYALNLGQCILGQTPPPMMSLQQSSWITLSYANGQWSYSFDGSAPPQALVFQY